jgi:hypothetical protein
MLFMAGRLLGNMERMLIETDPTRDGDASGRHELETDPTRRGRLRWTRASCSTPLSV